MMTILTRTFTKTSVKNFSAFRDYEESASYLTANLQHITSINPQIN